MPPFAPIINFLPEPTNLKDGADIINTNFAYAINKTEGILTIPSGTQVLIQTPTLTELKFLNTTPSDDPFSRMIRMSWNGLTATGAPIEQMRFDVFHSSYNPIQPLTAEARLYLNINSIGLAEILRIYQYAQFHGSELTQFALNPRSFFTDQEATLAVLAPVSGLNAKLKIANPDSGGGTNDGINLIVTNTGVAQMKFGTPSLLEIPRSGGSSNGRIVFYPNPSTGYDTIGINSEVGVSPPVGTLSVHGATDENPVITLQKYYWDIWGGPFNPKIQTWAQDGTLGEMGWRQIDYPTTPRRSQFYITCSNGGVTPDIELKITDGNVFYSNAVVTDEGLRNEERLSQVNYINGLSDFPTSGPDIWFPEGTMWDANNIPFTITQDIYLNKGVTVRNLIITTGNKIDIGDDASDYRFINLINCHFFYTGSSKDGLLGGESKADVYDGFDLYCKDISFDTDSGGKFFNFTSVFAGIVINNVSITIDNCKFLNGIGGTFYSITKLYLKDISIKDMLGGFFASNSEDVRVQNLTNLDSPSPNSLIPIALADWSITSRNQNALINGVSQTGGNAIYISGDSSLKGVLTHNLIESPDVAMIEDVVVVTFLESNLTGQITEGQIITGVSSGAQGYAFAVVYDSIGTPTPGPNPEFVLWILKTNDNNFTNGETVTSPTGSADFIFKDDATGTNEKNKNIQAKGNIGIPDSSAYGHISDFIPGSVPTTCPAGIVKRINATYDVNRVQRFIGYPTGNLEYIGLDPIECDVSFNIFAFVGSGPKLCTFYFAKGNLTNTVVSIVNDDPGLIRVTTSKPHEYSQFDSVLLEGTTLYDDSYLIQTIIDDYTFKLVATYAGDVFTGFHSRIYDDIPISRTLNTAEPLAASRPIDKIKPQDILFLTVEIATGDILYTTAISFSATKIG